MKRKVGIWGAVHEIDRDLRVRKKQERANAVKMSIWVERDEREDERMKTRLRLLGGDVRSSMCKHHD